VRFVVIGAGAIGGVAGARLFEHGYEVTLVARGAHYEAIRDKGLVVESPESTVTLPVPVVDDPRRVRFGDDDIVVLATKSQQTGDALGQLHGQLGSATPIVCLQNGVDNERFVLRTFANVYAVCVMCPATHLSPGVVQAHSVPTTGILDLGRYPAGVDSVAVSVAGALQASTFVSEARADIMRWKYAKLLMNLGNAVEAACGPEGRRSTLVDLARVEGEACFRAAGIDYASSAEDTARRGNLLNPRPIGGTSRGGGSSWQSLTRQTGSIETDYLNGEIVLLGRLYGVPTPVNAALQRLAADMAAKQALPGSVSTDDVLSLVAVAS
jgi:2-dehydropantoate 2-reductase